MFLGLTTVTLCLDKHVIVMHPDHPFKSGFPLFPSFESPTAYLTNSFYQYKTCEICQKYTNIKNVFH